MTSSVSGTLSKPSNSSPRQSSSSTPVIKSKVNNTTVLASESSEEQFEKRDTSSTQHFVVGKNLEVAFKNGERSSLEEFVSDQQRLPLDDQLK